MASTASVEGTEATLTQPQATRTRPWSRWPWVSAVRVASALLAVSVAYGVLARLSLEFVLQPQGIAPAWPAAGIATGALLLAPTRRWPLLLLAVAAAAGTAYLLAGTAPPTAAGLTAANLVEPLLAATTLRRLGFAGLATLRGVGQFLAVAVLGAPVAGGLLAATTVALTVGAPFPAAAATWLFAHAAGLLAIAPVVLTARPVDEPASGGRWLEALEVGTLLVLITSLAFLPTWLPVQMAAYPVFLLVLVAALRFGIRGAAWSTFGVALIATTGTMAGHGPIAGLNVDAAPMIQIGQAHVMVAVVFLVSFVTAAAMAERRATSDALAVQMAAEANRARISEQVAAFARDIARTLEPDAAFQQIVQSAIGVVPADVALLTVVDDLGPAHRVVAAVGGPGLIGRIIEPGDGVTGAAIRDGVPTTAPHLEPADRVSAAHDLSPSDAPMTVTSVPVLRDESVVATIGLARFDVDRTFDADELRALEMMAGLTAVALANVHAYGQAQDRSIRDELTGLPNRRYFTASYEQLAAQRERQPAEARIAVSAILFDLDHFGSVNKERGHETGDRVLARFGQILATRLRRADVVARYGGEEFVALLLGTERDAAVAVAEEIRRAFAECVVIGADGDPIRCTVSAGVATVPAGEASLEPLVVTADVALSMAKRAGRNTVAAA